METICFLLLERVRGAQLIKSSVDKYARPYMDEYKLDSDRTLYNYILASYFWIKEKILFSFS